jgi:hypothetical protein
MLHVRRFATASDQMQLAIASGTNTDATTAGTES